MGKDNVVIRLGRDNEVTDLGKSNGVALAWAMRVRDFGRK